MTKIIDKNSDIKMIIDHLKNGSFSQEEYERGLNEFAKIRTIHFFCLGDGLIKTGKDSVKLQKILLEAAAKGGEVRVPLGFTEIHRGHQTAVGGVIDIREKAAILLRKFHSEEIFCTLSDLVKMSLRYNQLREILQTLLAYQEFPKLIAKIFDPKHENKDILAGYYLQSIYQSKALISQDLFEKIYPALGVNSDKKVAYSLCLQMMKDWPYNEQMNYAFQRFCYANDEVIGQLMLDFGLPVIDLFFQKYERHQQKPLVDLMFKHNPLAALSFVKKLPESLALGTRRQVVNLLFGREHIDKTDLAAVQKLSLPEDYQMRLWITDLLRENQNDPEYLVKVLSKMPEAMLRGNTSNLARFIVDSSEDTTISRLLDFLSQKPKKYIKHILKNLSEINKNCEGWLKDRTKARIKLLKSKAKILF